MERFFSWVASSGFCCWNFQKAVNNTFYNLLFYNLSCVSEPSQSPFLFMIRSLFSISLLIALFFSSFSMAKKKRSPYWAPPRFVATTSPSHSNLSDSDSLALQRVLQSENQRLVKDPYLLQAIFHRSPRVATAAVLALGRVGDPYAIEALSRVLSGNNVEQKKLAAFSLGLIGDELSVRLLSQYGAMEKKPAVRGAFYRALGLTHQFSALSILSRALMTESDPAVLTEISEGFGLLIGGDSKLWEISEETLARLAVLSESSSPLGLSAAFALSRYQGDPAKLPIKPILASLSKNSLPFAKSFLVRSLAKVESNEVTTLLLATLVGTQPITVRIEAAKSLKGKKISALMNVPFKNILLSGNNRLIAATLLTLLESPDYFRSLSEEVANLFKNSPSLWIQGMSLKTLCALNPEVGRKTVSALLLTPSGPLTSAAVASLVVLHTPEDLAKLIPFFKEGNPKVISEAIELMAGLKADQFSVTLVNSLLEIVKQKDLGLLTLLAELAKQQTWKVFVAPLVQAYASLITEDTIEAKVAIISSIGVLGSQDELGFLNAALKDNSRQVVAAAMTGIKLISGVEPAFVPLLNNKVIATVPEFLKWRAALNKRVLLETRHGNIQIRFFDEAPITTYLFQEFVKTQFYNGKIFHREVPNFVVQGGDPRGDGFGGPGFLIRDEVGPRAHERGTLGIATSGKDTGGCQFFFNLSPNFHLNGRYTVFAEVVSGLDVMDRLEVGDKIISAKIQ